MRYVIAIIGILIIVMRNVFPKFVFDNTSLSIFVVVVVTLLFPELSKFLSKVKRIKAGGIELELDTLTKKTEKIEEKIEKVKVPMNLVKQEFSEIKLSEGEKNNPQVLLINIAIKIEKVLNSLSEPLTITKGKIPFSRKLQIELLTKEGIVNKQISSLFIDFWAIRNKVIHGHNLNISETEMYRIIDLGYKLLNLLKNEKNSIIVRSGYNYEKVVSEILEDMDVNFSAQQSGKDIGYDFFLTNNSKNNFLIEIKYWIYNLDKSVINQIIRIIEVYKTDLILISNIELSNQAYEYLQIKQQTISNKVYVIIGNTREVIKSQLENILN